jgi:uncharacterized protein (DUF1697 family)
VYTYVALFRGINVGGKHRLLMKELASLLDEMGYVEPRTYIQSGNVVLRSARELGREDAEEIGRRVLERKGFRPKVLLLGEADLRSAAANNPFPTTDGRILHLFFLDSPAERPNLEQLESVRASSEKFELRAGVFYLHAPDGMGRSRLAASVERALGVPVTARNWNTVAKLLSMIDTP